MITRIAIENFKGIGDRIEVPIRPITLLFGPNSAGKSSIMHAIHYAREVLERHNLDADRTLTGGDCVNLGGFREMVHRHESDRQIRIRFDLDFGSVKWHERFPVMEFPFEIGTSEVDLSTLGLDIMSGWVEVTIGYDNPATDQQPVVLAYEVGIDGIGLARIEYAPIAGTGTDVESQAMLTRLNLRHPAITWPEERPDSAGPIDFLFPEFHTFLDSAYYGGKERRLLVGHSDGSDAHPRVIWGVAMTHVARPGTDDPVRDRHTFSVLDRRETSRLSSEFYTDARRHCYPDSPLTIQNLPLA